jgi:hypothetical protein
MLRLAVQSIAAQLLPQLKTSTYSGISRINRLSFLMDFLCLPVGW